MKPIFNGVGTNVAASTIATLKSNRNLVMADLYHVVLTGGGQSRNQIGFVARWTDRDYPILSNYFNNVVKSPLQWPPFVYGPNQTGIFYPQRIKRGSIESKVGLEVAGLDVEVFLNDSLTSTIPSLGGPLKPPGTLDSSIPPYRDAFSLSQADLETVIETLKVAAWRGELDNVRFSIWRAFMPSDNGDVGTLGVMPLFSGFVKQFDVTRLSVHFQLASLVDIFTTTQTPTQVITNTDRGGTDFINIPALPHITCNVQAGSTRLALIGDGGAPPSLVEIDGEQQQIPVTGPFTVAVVNSGANFVADLGVVFSGTGLALVKVGSNPHQGQYAVSATGVYTFNSADAGQGVSISYTFNQTSGGTLANGILVYTYGAGRMQRPDASPVIRQVYTNTFVGGLNQIYLFEPLPILPAPTVPGPGDTFVVYQPQAQDSAQSVFGKGFPFVPKPESAL